MKTSLRITSLLALGLHMTGIAAASDLGSTLPDNIQELTLLDSIHKLSAQNLSSSDYLAQMQPIVQNYEKNSSTDGRVERLSNAIVEMNLMSADHLNEVKSSIANELSSKPNMSAEQKNQIEEKAILGSMQNLNGAPFAGGYCSLFVGGGALVIGAIFADVVASSFTSSQSSSSVSVSGTGTASGASGSSNSSSNSGSTTTTTNYQSSSNTPNASEKKLILTASFVGYGLGATALIFAIVDASGDGDCSWSD